MFGCKPSNPPFEPEHESYGDTASTGSAPERSRALHCPRGRFRSASKGRGEGERGAGRESEARER